MDKFRRIFKKRMLLIVLGGWCFCAAVYAQKASSSGTAEKPSIEVATVVNSSIFAEGAISSEETAASGSRSSQPTGEVDTIASQTPTSTAATSGTSFASSNGEISDSKWHFYGTGYLWLPGIHGTLGVRGYDTGVHVSAIDLLSKFRLGVLGVFTPTYNRFSFPVDFMWMKLKDDKAVPPAPNYSVQAVVKESIVTPKFAYLVLNNPKLKVHGTMGPRFWYESTSLTVNPTVLGLNPYKSVAWTDFVAGARFSTPLGTKASLGILGDAGGGGATLDYQIAGLINYQLKPKLALQGGWRYLTVHYGNNGSVFNGTMQGIVIGITYKFK
jgi:hypothetical protein